MDVDLGDDLGDGLDVDDLDFSDITNVINDSDLEDNLDEDLFADDLDDSLDSEEI